MSGAASEPGPKLVSGLIKMGYGTGGTASSVLFCIALRCSPNLSLKVRLVCPNKSHNYGSWSEVFRWCVWGAFTFTKLYHVNEIFIGTFGSSASGMR